MENLEQINKKRKDGIIFDSDLEFKRNLTKSTIFLIISNLITIIFALIEQWDITSILLIYWCQSVIIGYFNFKLILNSRKRKFANFFGLHYGAIHLFYLLFITDGSIFGFFNKMFYFQNKVSVFIWGLLLFCLAIITFYVNHRKSFILNFRGNLKYKSKVSLLMFMPYIRIIPMHLTMLFAISIISTQQLFDNYNPLILVFFLFLKTFADVLMHNIEHRYLKNSVYLGLV